MLITLFACQFTIQKFVFKKLEMRKSGFLLVIIDDDKKNDASFRYILGIGIWSLNYFEAILITCYYEMKNLVKFFIF